MEPRYDHKAIEDGVYERWEKSGYFNPDNLPYPKTAKPYCIIMPPPNVTGVLHIGHSLMLTIEDILIRFERMRGKKTLWLPGTDHAAIATQSKVESIIYKEEGKTRYDYGREEFLKKVEAYAKDSHDTIVSQIRKMGSSCDWSREAYTLDEMRSRAVGEAFKRMYDGGIISRGKRIVNWDPKLQTTVSDDEIEWKEEKIPFYYVRYGPFTIATARPETKFGDKYVVMHPDDERYSKYTHGQKLDVEWINGVIAATVIKDPAVDMSFGTGVMTITPWHDAADFDIAKRHGLDFEQIIDFDGKLLPVAGEFAGAHIKKARPLIVEKLKSKGLIEKIDGEYIHRIAANSRGGGIIEPQIKEQWFVNVNAKFSAGSGSASGRKKQNSKLHSTKDGEETTVKEIMKSVVESGEIKIIPEHFEKIYYHWIDNLRDWCISRQIWYGHRIPVWYHEPKCVPKPRREDDCGRCKEVVVSAEKPVCNFCDGEYVQDSDTLDTSFSSGLWTFSTLGWPAFADTAMAGKPGRENDLANYHPTDVMETGYDILFFWIARMILMTTYFLGEVPFHTVYLHGIVRDAERQKMSKSKGNVIAPLAMSEKYGTDALRIALVFATAAGNDISLQEDRIRGMKHFSNKLWNIARFVLARIGDAEIAADTANPPPAITGADRDILKKMKETISEVNSSLEDFSLHRAAQAIYDFTWHEFADTYVEESKKQLDDEAVQQNTKRLLLHVLANTLKLLHPFMPFITEEIWSKMPIRDKKMLMIEQWPR